MTIAVASGRVGAGTDFRGTTTTTNTGVTHLSKDIKWST